MKKLIAVLLSVMFVFAMAACGGSSSSTSAAPSSSDSSSQSAAPTVLEKIKAAGKIVVGTEAQYAPYEFKDLDAKFVGCDIWLAQQIADGLGVELEIVDMAFDGIIPAIQAGQVDIGIAAFTTTAERAEMVDFSSVYISEGQLLIVKKGNEDTYSTIDSLKGLQVGAQRGTIQSLLIASAMPESTLFELDKYPELALEVANGNIAGLVVDASVGEGLVNTNENLVVSKLDLSEYTADFGKACLVAKGNEDLIAAVNVIIDKVVADGSFQTAYEEAVALQKTLGL